MLSTSECNGISNLVSVVISVRVQVEYEEIGSSSISELQSVVGYFIAK